MYYHFSILGLIFIVYILIKVKNKLFSEVKSLLWILGGILVLILPLFPSSIMKTAKWLNIDYAPSVLFLLSIVFIIFIIFRQEQDVSKLNEKVKELAQRNTLLEEKIRKFER